MYVMKHPGCTSDLSVSQQFHKIMLFSAKDNLGKVCLYVPREEGARCASSTESEFASHSTIDDR